jgi:hypothetical protein
VGLRRRNGKSACGGLSNEYNVWASDIEQGNVETMQSRIDIDENLKLLEGHVFQFDFLNESFDKLPEELRTIINDPEKRKKLIVYINPPYAEAGNQKMPMGGGNHWRPFAEKEVGAKEKFEFAFMSNFLAGKTLSAEAAVVLDAGWELWKYYHTKIKNNKTMPANASFYDIREYFQGRNDKGLMKSKVEDETYNALLAALREKQKALTAKIQPKVYEYGFLKE